MSSFYLLCQRDELWNCATEYTKKISSVIRKSKEGLTPFPRAFAIIMNFLSSPRAVFLLGDIDLNGYISTLKRVEDVGKEGNGFKCMNEGLPYSIHPWELGKSRTENVIESPQVLTTLSHCPTSIKYGEQ